MGRIGILGGTFDPPHIGHLLMAEEARLKMSLDEVWWMPNHVPPHKEKDSSTSEKDRVAMVKSMVVEQETYSLCELELQRGGLSYTYDTVVALREEFPQHKFYFIIGEDSLITLHTWYRSEELRKLISFIVIRRPGYHYDEKMDTKGITIIEGPTINVSSTTIRSWIKEKKFNKFLVTNRVFSIIKERQLYE